MFITKWLLATTVAAGLATGVSAATLTGSTSGQFSATPGGTNSCVFDGGSSIAWGDPNSCPDTNGVLEDDSTLTIKNFAFNEDVASATQVQIGELEWFNEANTAAVNFTAFANLTLSVTNPALAGSPFSEGLNFQIDNTPDNPADNILALTFSDFGITLPAEAGGLVLSGFSFALLSPVLGESLSVGPTGNPNLTGVQLSWTNPERNTSRLGIFADVNVAAIPLPAAGWLLLAGLGGLAAVRRRRKAA